MTKTLVPHLDHTMRVAAEYLTKARLANEWMDRCTGPEAQAPAVQISWDVGASLPGYEGLRVEIRNMIEIGMHAFLVEAQTRIQARANQAIADLRPLIDGAPD